MLEGINWLAVLVAAIAFFALGSIWYTVLFGKTWARLVGMDPEGDAGNMAATFAATFVLELVASLALAILLHQSGHRGWAEGAHLGLLVGLGVVTPALAINYLYQRRPQAMTAIDGGHMTLGLVIAGAILGSWP